VYQKNNYTESRSSSDRPDSRMDGGLGSPETRWTEADGKEERSMLSGPTAAHRKNSK